MQSVKEILNEIKEKRLNVSEIARKTGIPVSRFHKWIVGENNPKADDADKLRIWAVKNLDKEGKNKSENDDAIQDNEPFFKLYIDSLIEQKRILEVQNEFLRRNFETSLVTIAETQHASHSTLKALSWYQAVVASGGDEGKAEEVLVKMNNKAAWYAGIGLSKDTAPLAGKNRKAEK